MDLTKYERIFSQESDKYLKELDDLLLNVEKDLSNRTLWTDIHGKIHSIKGMARALSLDKISELCHLMEEWCLKFQQGKSRCSESSVQLIFNGSDILRSLVSKSGRIESLEEQKVYNGIISGFRKSPEEIADNVQEKPPLILPASRQKISSIDHVKIRYSHIEELLGLTQEIQLLAKRFPLFSQDKLSAGLKNWVGHYNTLMKTLYFQLTQLRLMSFGDFADLFQKSIRSTAREHNKNIHVEIIGSEIQADITILERLREPMVHIFRNCIAHGIETPQERIRNNKPPEGRITIEAKSEKESLYIKIRDDGRGINKSLILRHLREKESLTDDRISNMTEEEIFNTILSPDFSSARETTDLSGRGIGMSVVAQTIDYMGGSLSISSEPGKQTEFTIKLPISLSVIYAIVFTLGNHTLAVPTLNVKSIGRLYDSSKDNDGTYYDIRKHLGIADGEKKLTNFLSLKYAGPPAGSGSESGGLKLLADNIIGNRPLMVLPVGELLSRIKLFSGVGIMENGDISMLLDVDNLP
jgi:two-component system, chemotaxis family, sensor kinase CheA